MKNKKKKFGSAKETLILIQQLQVRYFNKLEIKIFVLGKDAFGAWIDSDTRVFYQFDTAEERESKYNEFLTYINDKL